jgi:hypothetical protein
MNGCLLTFHARYAAGINETCRRMPSEKMGIRRFCGTHQPADDGLFDKVVGLDVHSSMAELAVVIGGRFAPAEALIGATSDRGDSSFRDVKLVQWSSS